ncbi:hypothetical protein [Paenibacillus sp. y28]|uniref:hypothetical protein n=1 Tax=Paenibacillus sp. y28 TaxID=3129110 RepID=UPI00301A36EE
MSEKDMEEGRIGFDSFSVLTDPKQRSVDPTGPLSEIVEAVMENLEHAFTSDEDTARSD